MATAKRATVTKVANNNDTPSPRITRGDAGTTAAHPTPSETRAAAVSRDASEPTPADVALSTRAAAKRSMRARSADDESEPTPKVTVTVAAGRSIQTGRETFGEGAEVEIGEDEVEKLVAAGVVVKGAARKSTKESTKAFDDAVAAEVERRMKVVETIREQRSAAKRVELDATAAFDAANEKAAADRAELAKEIRDGSIAGGDA